eukprot:CAMPEP_0181305828 /NCGR_PEP_ID=MMETSP1101-20121128/9952_1 /TAXON_ID=46948 /ORGANISM="Rhodomonas abbreviata, Strain Caron Lab Isolate" /LENGTH=1956 /DNA_ID=CAMNT_0023411799 /DNA_START=677 /DNA_END=6547 /DNA_ORIENTATION=+
MANLQWKNNPIEKLESIANPDDEPSFADFESWKDNTFRSTISVGIPYIKKMIYDLEWNGGDPPILVPNAAAPEDYLGTEFQQSVIRMAVNAGREFSMPEPTGDLFRAINYKNIIAEVNSFGQQVARAGRKWHSEIFTQAEFADWPLKPLLEWKTMEVEYNPTRRSADTATYWKELNAALAPTEVSLEPDAMKQWIKAISLPRNELIRLQPATTVDSAIIGRVLDPIINADDKQPNHKQWSIQAVKWEETYSSNPSAMPWPTLKALLLKFVSKFAKDTKSANSSSAKRPRVSPAAPTGMALTAQHDETFQVALEAAYAAIHQGAGSAQEQRNQYPISPHPNPSIVCDNCGGRGHIQMFCPSPKFTRQQTMPPQQRISRWERGRGRGGTRGGMTRGGSGPPFHRDSGHQGSSGASRGQSSGSRGHSRGTPFHGLRGGSQTRTAPQTEPFLDVVDANAAAGLIAYDPDDEGEEWQENDQHHEDTQESSLFAFPPGQFGRAAERGQDFRTQFISGQDFGHHDAKSPPISAPDWADLESQPALDAPPPIPPTRPRLAARAREVAASMCSLIWFLPLLRTVATTIAATTPPAPRTPTAILSVILLLSTTLVLFPSIATFAFKSDLTRDTAFVSGFTANSTTTYLVDSGCTTSIICDPRFLRNYERMNTVSVAGLAGNKEYKWKAELHLPTLTDQGESITLIIPGCYWDPDGYYNLLATDQLHDAGYSILLDENRQHSMLTSKKLLTNIPMSRVGRLHDLPVHEHALPETTAFLGSNSNLSLEELFHMRMAHTPVPKLAQMSRQVEGVPRHLQCARALRFPCATGQHAKAIRQNYPDASTRVSNSNDALISWDLIDLGENFTTIGGNRYLSLFIIERSRFAITILHKDRSDFKQTLQRAFAKAGFTPKVVRSDGAAEYLTPELDKFFTDNGIEHQVSNPYEQFQNAISEKFVDTLGKGLRTLLLSSELPPEFWGCAAIFYTDVYNHLLHASIGGQIPYALHHNRTPDVSWFRPFGCRATVFRGRDLVDHHKLAPRGEQGIFVGLGMSHGRKCWLIYTPRLNRIFVSRNVTFDETLFPLKHSDQRVYGIYDNQSVQQLRADAYGLGPDVSVVDDILNMPTIESPTTTSVEIHAVDDADADKLLSQAETNQQFSDDEYEIDDLAFDDKPPLPHDTPTTTEPVLTAGDTACHPGGGPTCNSGGGSISNHRGGPTEHAASNHGGGQSSQQPSVKVAPAGELRPVKRPTFNEAPLTYGTPHRKWWHCENAAIDDTSDEHLAEFLIGHSIDISFPAEYWPGDNGTWHGQAYDTGYDHKHFQQQLCLKTLIHNSSVKRKTGTWTYVPVSKPPGVITDVSARRALKLQFPKATLCKHLTGPHPKTVEKQPKRVTRSETRETARKSQLAATDLDKADKKLPLKSRVSQAALLTFATLSMLHSMQHEHGFISQFQPLEPKSQKEARASPQCLEWRKAEHVELKTVWDMGTFRIVDRQSHVIPLPSRFTYHLKRNRDGTISKYKARIVARGDMQTEDEYSTTYAPTSRFTAIRTIISIAAQEQMLLKHWDITGAFMTADIDTKIYMELPPGYSLPDGKCIELAKSLYGLRQSPGLFHDTLETWLLDYGFEPVGADRVIFKLARGTEKILLSLYVDDGLCATNSQALYDTFLADLSRKFALSDQGELSWYLGVGIDHNLSTGVTTLSQEQFVETIIERFSMQGCKPVSTPAEPHSHLLVSDCPATPDKDAVRKYQQIVGSLMYLSCFTRPDISYAVNQCAKFMSNPGPAHMLAAKRIIKYLAGTKDKRITYTRTNNAAEANVFTCYADADHAGDPDSRRSVTGYVTTLNGGAVSWQSVRQQVTALSSAEAEFYAASVAGTDVQYVRRLAEELGYPQLLPTPVFEDNMACIFMSESAAMYHKARHIDTRVYHLRELVKDGVVKLFKIPTESQVADSLTKATPRPAFMEHVRGMMGG